jgi:predicted dehydrogenase
MTMQSKLNRRSFTNKVSALTSIAFAAPAINVMGANEKIQLGCIGIGDRGKFHLRQFLGYEDVKITALADPKQDNLDQALHLAGDDLFSSQDFRHVLDRNDVDAIVIASPDHWHAIQMIMACQAGKDVYVEKPMGHTVEEQQRMIQSQKKFNRVVSVGMQQRSGNQFQMAVEMVKSGEIGDVNSVHCINMWDVNNYLSQNMQSITSDTQNSSSNIDYEMWLGPAPKSNVVPGWKEHNFYFFLDYAGGMMTGWGVHLFDIVMWAMGPEINAVKTIGGKYAFDSLIDTPDTAEVLFDCPNYTFNYSMRHGNGFPHDPELSGIDHGIYFYGTKATILVNRWYAKVYPEDDRSKVQIIPASDMDQEHKRNFLSCVRSRNTTAATVQDGHNANIPGLLGLISWRVGREVRWDYENETILNDDEAKALLKKDYRSPWNLPAI